MYYPMQLPRVNIISSLEPRVEERLDGIRLDK